MAEECIDYYCADLAEHELLSGLCGGGRLGGGHHLILGLCGTTLADPSDETEINALIASQEAFVAANLKIALNAPSPVLVDATTACGTQDVATYDRSATIEDYNVTKANCDFYTGVLGGRRFAWALIFECDTDGLTSYVTYINNVLKANGGRQYDNNNTTFQKYVWTLNWRGRGEPCLFDTPVGVTGIDA